MTRESLVLYTGASVRGITPRAVGRPKDGDFKARPQGRMEIHINPRTFSEHSSHNPRNYAGVNFLEIFFRGTVLIMGEYFGNN